MDTCLPYLVFDLHGLDCASGSYSDPRFDQAVDKQTGA